MSDRSLRLMKFRRTIRILMVAGAIIVSGPSMPQTIEAKLYISAAGNGQYLVIVDGRGPGTGAVSIRVRGEDEWFDDSLFGYSSTSLNGTFNAGIFVASSALNEDWGRDEVYANVTMGNRSIRTNTIRRSF